MSVVYFCNRVVRYVTKNTRIDNLLPFLIRLSSTQSSKALESEPSRNNKIERLNLDRQEVERHEKLISGWWDINGPLKPLHAMNDLRVKLIVNGFINAGRLDEEETKTNPFYLKGFKICDIGCGGGILSEALCRLGADVTGIDPGEELIELANMHANANSNKLPIKPNYIITTIEEHAKTSSNIYDGLIASEVIEHVPGKDEFVQACLQTVKPGGSIFFTTPNRTFFSWLGLIFIAENVINIIPKGIHQYEMFITPDELKSLLEKLGCRVVLMNGSFYNFMSNEWFFSSELFHYTIHAIKNKTLT